ncbi:GIY-YIG nuclease family protein [Streptomyces sp. NPDC015220]|uniref:GIY-YIG nuclease family protein n=1 Tax=Streptomyces sp. NPDC015220 TaxID=3364947 RepID=UPI0036FCD282
MTAGAVRTSLYRLYDAGNVLLYVGIAEDPAKRWAEHAANKTWWPNVTRRDVEWFPARELAEDAERIAITTERPAHNIRHAVPHLSDNERADLFARYKEAVRTERDLRPQVKEAAVQEMLAGASVTQLAKLTGMTPEVFRRIARAEGVERKREPTVGREVEAKRAGRDAS